MASAKIDHPFDEFEIASHKPLNGLKRSTCPKCKASRMYFCYTCYKYVVGIDESLLPRVKLPIPVDIIKHPKELDGKSTAVHAALLAPDDVHIYTYPVFPNYAKENLTVLLIFPGPEAKSLEDFVNPSRPMRDGEDENDIPAKRLCQGLDNEKAHSGKTDLEIPKVQNDNLSKQFKFDRLVMIDSTWNQVHSVSTDQRLQGLSKVELTQRTTLYWRRQNHSPNTYLSTVEALYCFMRQFHELLYETYDKRYDNLLYFFKFFYDMVHNHKASKTKNK